MAGHRQALDRKNKRCITALKVRTTQKKGRKKLKKFLAALVLVFSLTGVYVVADAREATSQPGANAMGVVYGSLNPLVMQEGRRRRRRWQMNNNNNNWNRRRWARRRWENNGRHRGEWNRRGRRGRRGGDHGGDH